MPEYIDREEVFIVIDRVEQQVIRRTGSPSYGLATARIEIEDLHAADVAPVRHGKWMRYSFGDCIVVCSECRTIPKAESVYCPTCGARMDGEE